MSTGKRRRQLITHGREVKGADVWTAYNNAVPILSTLNTDEHIFLLNGVSRGPEFYRRTGKEIRILAVRFRMTLRWTWAVGTNLTTGLPVTADPTPVRVTIFWDKQPGGVLPKWNEVFGSADQNGPGLSAQASDLIRMDKQSRFSIVRDWILVPNTNYTGVPQDATPTPSALNTSWQTIDEFIDLGGRRTVYDDAIPGSTVDYRHLVTGALLVAVRAYQGFMPMGPTWLTTITWLMPQSRSRIRFVDS